MKSLNETFLAGLSIMIIVISLVIWLGPFTAETEKGEIADFKCPSEYSTFEESVAAFDSFLEDYFNRNPNASIADASTARRNFYVEHNCTEELKRISAYENGTADKEQVKVFNNVVSEVIFSTKENLCQLMNFTEPLDQEIKYNEEISQDDFIKYLRKSIDDFVNKEYETGDICVYRGLYKGVHCEDSAYNSDTGPALFTENPSVLRGKFIVLQTDTAPGGGVFIVFLFKNNPSKIYYAWVFGEESGYFDLRGLYEYSQKEGGPSIAEIQKTYINQICNEEIGI